MPQPADRRLVTEEKLAEELAASGETFSGSYLDLTNKPTIPTTAAQVGADPAGSAAAVDASLAPVAKTGVYADLTGKPTIPTTAAQVGAEPAGAVAALNAQLKPVAKSGVYADLTGKPTLAAVATSGAYADLTGKPTLAAVATSGDYNDLTNVPAGGGGGSGAASGINPETYNVLSTNDYATNTANWPAVVNAASAARTWINIEKDYLGRIDHSNKHFKIRGGGSIITTSATSAAISAVHTPGPVIAVTAVSEVILGPLTSKPSPPQTMSHSQIAVAQSSLNQFKSDDLYRITARELYAWGGSNTYWKAEFFPVAGVLFPVTVTGAGIKENDTITGVTSGATGFVGSYAPDTGGTTGKVLLKSLTGTFTVGESIRVSGVTIGTIQANGTVMRKGALHDTYSTTVQVRKVPDWDYEISGVHIKSNADTDALVGTANRSSAINILGGKNGVIRGVTIDDAWSAAVSNASGWRMQGIDITINNLPNNATTGGTTSNQPSEQAYGYGWEDLACSEGTEVRINGANLRHAYTTNVTEYSSYPSGSEASMLLTGTAKNNKAGGVAINPWSAGWDTHLGAYNTKFESAVTRNSVSGYRYFSASKGFQNRGFNTEYVNCSDYGSLYGFSDLTGNEPLTTMSVTRFTNTQAIDYQYAGYIYDVAAESKWHRLVFQNALARGDGRTLNQPYGSVGFVLGNVDADLFNCVSERFSSTPIQLSGAGSYAPTTILKDFVADYRESPTTSASGIRISGAAAQTLVISDLGIIQNPLATSTPASAVRNVSGNATIRFLKEPENLNTTTAIPRSSIDAGTPTITFPTTGGGGGSNDRANHTGTQLASTISDFTEAAQDAVWASIVQGSGMAITKDDTSNQITFASTGGGGGGAAASFSARAIVYSSTFPSPPAADNTRVWVCDGTADDVQINAALTAVGTSGGKVQLVGNRFYIAAPLVMRTGAHLQGEGLGTILKATADFEGGMITNNVNTDHAMRVSDMSLHGQTRRVHGIDWDISGGPSWTGEPNTSPDSANRVDNLYIYSVGTNAWAGYGLHLRGGRANMYSNIRILNASGIGVWIDGSVDSHYFNVEAGSCGDESLGYSESTTAPLGHGFYFNGANNLVTNCKSWYSRGAGFFIRDARSHFSNCQAQDNYGAGFQLHLGNIAVTGCVSDSNGQGNGANGMFRAGFYFKYFENAVVTGCVSLDRGGQAWAQQYGFQFTSTVENSQIIGCSTYGNAVSSVTGTPGPNTIVQISNSAGK